MTEAPDVVIVGMGYVGLILAATLADLGFNVFGYEREPAVVQRLNRAVSILKADLRPIMWQN